MLKFNVELGASPERYFSVVVPLYVGCDNATDRILSQVNEELSDAAVH